MRTVSPVSPALSKSNRSLVPLNRVQVQPPADAFLLTRLEDFYRQVLRLKSLLASAPAPETPADIQRQLIDFLAGQENAVERIGSLLGNELYRQTQRICACLADEIFGRVDWPRGQKWPSLEAHLFSGTEHAGFASGGQCQRKLKELLRQGDPVYRELASVYFYALALAKPDHADAEAYMGALVQFLPPPPIARQWFPQNYAHTLNEDRITSIPSAAKWLWALASIVVIWFGLSWFLWVRLSAPVEKNLRAIGSAAIPVQEIPEVRQP